jgi:hypothetical protein
VHIPTQHAKPFSQSSRKYRQSEHSLLIPRQKV